MARAKLYFVVAIVSLAALLAVACAGPNPTPTPTPTPAPPTTSPAPTPAPPGTIKQVSQEESQRIAEEFVRRSRTFVFDGMEDTLRLVETITLRCPSCWQFIFEFQSRHAGYGDRTGQMLAQVITPHRALITVMQGEVTYAVIDQKWDMIKQAIIDIQGKNPEGTLSVAELLENPVYDAEIRIYGKVSLLGELFCPCFELTADGEKVMVWYDLMVEDNGEERPPVSVEGIENGDQVMVTGELKTEGTYRSLNDFWASNIGKIE